MASFQFPHRAIWGFASICIAVLLSFPKVSVTLSGAAAVKPVPQQGPVSTITFTFDPPMSGGCPLKNVRVTIDNVCPNTIVAANAGGDCSPPSQRIDPNEASSEPEDVLGINVYRVPFPAVGQPIPTPEEVINSGNLIGSIPSNATGFTDKVSTSSFGFGFIYAFTCLFGNGTQSGGSSINVVLPAVNNPIFKKGAFFFDAAGSFIQPGAVLIVEDKEAFPLVLTPSGVSFTVPKGARSVPGGFTLKQLLKKGRSVKLAIKNPGGINSCPVLFTRR